jgi:hypothetical protein
MSGSGSTKQCLNMQELVASPLGVLVLARSMIEVGGAPPLAPFDPIACCLQALAVRVPSKGYFDPLSAERLSELIAQCETGLTPFHDGYPHEADVLVASGPALRPFAAELLAAPGAATWFRDLDRNRQEWVCRTSAPPQASSFRPDLQAYGAGNTKPRRTLWTSTSVTERTSSWLQYVPISEDAGRWSPPYPRWQLEVLPSARVYEIHGPASWNNLCLAYPAPSCMAYPTCRPDALIEPDWQAVSQDWDGVHLSIGGLLTSERVRWGTPGQETHLFGWSVESTAWLRWVFGSVERLLDGG